MPRVARQHSPGVITHVITRFVDGQFLMDEVSGARERYLERLDRALARSDWQLLWYCLMGSHVHLGMLSGRQRLAHWIQGLHSGFASWTNWQRRAMGARSRGPVIADRPATIMVPHGNAGYLAAYIHNNPQRANVVNRALDCGWSSHRSYVLGAPYPRCLQVEMGLSLCGLGTDEADRAAFDRWVDTCREHPRDPSLSGATMLEARRAVRAQNGRAARVATPSLRGPGSAKYPVDLPPGATCREQVTAPIARLLRHAASLSGVEVGTLVQPGRARPTTRARRIAALACREGDRTVAELCAALGISDSAASYLIRTATNADKRLARRATELWRNDERSAG